MSSLLRSTKFVRYFCGAARTLILNSAKNVETNLLINSKSLYAANNVMVRDYASKKTESLEPLLLQMDTEIRRSGRITKRNIDELFDGIKTKHDISSSQSLLVIRCCGEILSEELPEKRTLLVQKIWSVLTDIGVPMDISHYNTLLRVYIENEHPFSPAEFLEELQNKGLQPNHVTYQRLIWRYCQEGDIEGATKVLENMRELGLPITVPVLNALVMGHSHHGDTDGAKAVLDTVASAGLQATNHTYSLLACGYAKKGDLQGVEQVLEMANEKDTFMTNKDVFSIIETLAENGHGDKIEPLFEHLGKGLSYRHDAHNSMLYLINKGQEEIATKILKTFNKPNEDIFYQGAFFIKQILRVNRSPEHVVMSCSKLQEDGVIPNALLIALESSLQRGQTELAQALLKQLQKVGIEVRQHYFWPLLVSKGKEGDEEGLLQILRNMSNEGVIPSKETVQNYVIPYLMKNSNPQDVIIKLQIANIPAIISVKNVLNELLMQGKIKEAAQLVQQYNIKENAFIKESLCIALNRTKDIDSFVKILHVTSAKSGIAQVDEASHDGDDATGTTNRYNDTDEIILRAVKGLKTSVLCENLLSKLLSKGIGINSHTAESIEEYLGQNMTSSISQHLSKLTSSDLEITPVQRANQSNIPRTSANLEHLIGQLKKKGNDTSGLQKQLLTTLIKEQNVAKVTQLSQELESETFTFTHTTLAQLMEFYCEVGDIDRVYHYKNMLETNYPDYRLYNYKLMQIAHALIKANRVDEAIEMFKKYTSDDSNFFVYNTKCWQVLNELAEQKNSAKLKELFQVLLDGNFITPTNVILGPLIKVHLLANDMGEALNEFESCCKQFRCTPWKGELMKQLIVAEDASKLQWLTDLSTQIHGEINVLYDLILAFVECGRLRQARRILETPGLRTRSRRLDAACKRYVIDGKMECIEGLLEATKELSNVDRSKIFFHLLVGYCNTNETDKALGLWNLLQEEGEVPSEAFLIHLGEHLKSQNRDIPFIIPDHSEKQAKNVTAKVESPPKNTNKEYSKKIESLIKSGNVEEATNLTINLLNDGIRLDGNVAALLLKYLAEAGNVDKILLLSPFYENEGKPINFQHKLNLAYVACGSGEKLVNSLESSLQKAQTADEFQKVASIYPRATALNSIIQNEQLANKCHDIALQLASKDQILPVNLLWMEYILNGNTQKADDLWNNHLIKTQFVKFKRILQEMYVKKQPELIEQVIEYLKTNNNVTKQAIGSVYSRLITLHVDNKDIVNAKKSLEKALADGLTSHTMNLSALSKLKELYTENNEVYPYDLPKKQVRNDKSL